MTKKRRYPSHRRPPRPHTVRSHTRKGSGVDAYSRGSGTITQSHMKLSNKPSKSRVFDFAPLSIKGRRVRYSPSKTDPYAFDIGNPEKGHHIRVGYDKGSEKYYVVSHLNGKPLSTNYNLSKSEAKKKLDFALQGRDMSQVIRHRTR